VCESKTVNPTASGIAFLLHPFGVDQKAPDFAARLAADLAYIHHLFTKADEFYRYYRQALLNREWGQDEPKPTEWIPVSDH
jgi:hypothetical protein